ncbi:MAG: ParB N-terminal domain-containing protein, partial [Spirochaetales bacterium]|nr:ParB N-terminal domain-containing protein [Spirochaetales bacterium]
MDSRRHGSGNGIRDHRHALESIKEHGIIQPIIVRKSGERYKIIAGERRFRAARS